MNVKKILGLFAVAGLLAFAAPTERAQAASLNGPGIAAAVQGGASESIATEVQYRRGHAHGHRYHPRPRVRHHHHYRRPVIVHRPHHRPHRHQHYRRY